ncbi:L,D-transpeptidase [Paenibacillus naphthalenovorans]
MLFLLTLSASLLAQPLAAAPKSDKTKIEITDGLAEEGVYLIINKTSNRLTVVLNGRVAYSFPVATGRTKQLTPTGRFHIVTKTRQAMVRAQANPRRRSAQSARQPVDGD